MSYQLVIVARGARNMKAIGGSMSRVTDADLVVGKDNLVLKDRNGQENVKMSDRDLERVKADATEVVYL